MSKGIRNALIIGGSIVLVAVILVVYMYLPLDGLQYFAGRYSSGNDTSSQGENPTLNQEDDGYKGACRIISVSIKVSPGDVATVKAHGSSNTKYSIDVIYSSGPSNAKGLEDKISNADGYVEWSWTVSSTITPGIYKIYIKNEVGEEATTWIQVIE